MNETTPPKLLTVDEINVLHRLYESSRIIDSSRWHELLETALAAMRVVEAAQGVAIAKYGYSVPVNGSIESAQKSFEYVNRMLEPLNESLKPFQQTGRNGLNFSGVIIDDLGGRGDE